MDPVEVKDNCEEKEENITVRKLRQFSGDEKIYLRHLAAEGLKTDPQNLTTWKDSWRSELLFKIFAFECHSWLCFNTNTNDENIPI